MFGDAVVGLIRDLDAIGVRLPQARPVPSRLADDWFARVRGANPHPNFGSPGGYIHQIGLSLIEQHGDEACASILGVPETTEVVRALRDVNACAAWGATAGETAFVWEPGNRFIVMHELLHALGAADCYDMASPSGPPTCDLLNCIMQWEPTEDTVGAWPFVCGKNLDLIRRKQATP